ncbi:hypothetical protein [Azotobacter chroococcum]|uniref:hypothetical protein n=1 Tax=Azotobacter chroococcum TaxID=353 RepID=UPI0012FD003C|nr:hypothetical protein [Azotobacter chroococcum]
MAQDDKESRALAGLGASAAAAISILLGADIPPMNVAAGAPYMHTQQAKVSQQLVNVLEEIKASANELNEILDQVLIKLVNDPASAQQLSASQFPLLAETLRSLERYVRQAEDFCAGDVQRRDFLRALASIRSRVVDIVSIARQSSEPEAIFESSIDRKGLAALAELGTRNLHKLAG